MRSDKHQRYEVSSWKREVG